MSGYVETMTKANKGKDTTGKLCPDLGVMMNLFDHLTTTSDYAAMLHAGTTPRTLRSIANRLVGAITKVCLTAELIVYLLVVTKPPGFASWPNQVKSVILSLQKALQPAKIRSVITCPDFPVDGDFRPEPTLWPVVFAWLSKTVQSFRGLEAYDLTLDDAIIYD